MTIGQRKDNNREISGSTEHELLMTDQSVVTMSKTCRSRVANGSSLWLDNSGIDGRSREARRFRDILAQVLCDLGGADRLSEGERQLARRVSMLSMECEVMELRVVAGEAFDAEKYGMLTDRLGRALQRLGLHRVAKDVTPSLADIVARHRDAEAAERNDAARGRDLLAAPVSRVSDARRQAADATSDEVEADV